MLVDHENQNVGIVPTQQAMDMAAEVELDLVEVAPNAKPPVARIMDYSKFVYEKKRREREARKNQKKVEVKGIRMKLKTSPFHRGIQIRKAKRWLGEGKKVKAEIRFQGREITYPELGRKIMDEIAEETKDLGTIEQRAKLEGRKMIMILASTVPPKAAEENREANKQARRRAMKKSDSAEFEDDEFDEDEVEDDEDDFEDDDDVNEDDDESEDDDDSDEEEDSKDEDDSKEEDSAE